jgi:phenylacetic acid degradation operon negative regulatory protein
MNSYDIISGLMISLGKKEYSIESLKYLTDLFNIKESNLRTNLSRMKNNGIVQIRKTGKKAYYSLSEKYVRISKNVSLSFKNLSWEKWNGEWLGVAFSVPESNKSFRHKIRKKLTAYRLAALYPGFWIRPFNNAEKLLTKLDDLRKNNFCTFIKFNLIDAPKKESIIKMWNLIKVNLELLKGLSLLTAEKKTLKNITPAKALIKKINIGSTIVPLLFKDPLLPDCYLPDNWKGPELRKKFILWDELVTDISKPYWKKIFKQGEINAKTNF